MRLQYDEERAHRRSAKAGGDNNKRTCARSDMLDEQKNLDREADSTSTSGGGMF